MSSATPPPLPTPTADAGAPPVVRTSPTEVDVRGPRFAAWITTVVLVAVIVVSSFSIPGAAVVVGLQTAVFALGAVLGPRRSPYGRLFATVLARRLGPAVEREPVAPLRFAQGVGFGFGLIATLGFAFGAPIVGVIATAFALAAAALNAAFGICLGCLIYPFARRLAPRPAH